MIVQCPGCLSNYDDAQCWTICPHGPLWAASDAYCKKHDLVNCSLCAPVAQEARQSRPMHLVRQAILAAIPNTAFQNAVRQATDSALQTFAYAAPELHSRCWRRFSAAIEDVFNWPEYRHVVHSDWGKTVTAILRDEIDYRRYL